MNKYLMDKDGHLLRNPDYKKEVISKDECAICEGIFDYNEKVIEFQGVRYCEACWEDVENEKYKVDFKGLIR